jgi:hypothetical protein
MDLQQFLPIVIGLIIIVVIWKAIKGVIRLVLTLGVLAVIAYIVLNVVR